MSRSVDTNSSKSVANREIPVLTWKDTKTIKHIGRGHQMAQVMTSAPQELNLSDLAFALNIQDDSMSSLENKRHSFDIGDEIICDPTLSVSPGDFVLAYVKELDQTLFRQFRLAALRADGSEEVQLVPQNPNWPVITIISGKDGDIVAKMVRHSRSFP